MLKPSCGARRSRWYVVHPSGQNVGEAAVAAIMLHPSCVCVYWHALPSGAPDAWACHVQSAGWPGGCINLGTARMTTPHEA